MLVIDDVKPFVTEHLKCGSVYISQKMAASAHLESFLSFFSKEEMGLSIDCMPVAG